MRIYRVEFERQQGSIHYYDIEIYKVPEYKICNFKHRIL